MAALRALCVLLALSVLVFTVEGLDSAARARATAVLNSRSSPDNVIEFVEVDAFDNDQADQITEPCSSGCNSNGTSGSERRPLCARHTLVYVLQHFRRSLIVLAPHPPSSPSLPSPAGVCTQDGQCVCYDGFAGTDCSIKVCPAACALHGTCSGGVCQCEPGWTGYDCSFRGCKDDCSGHGACHIGPFNSECLCFSGYTGDACQISVTSGALTCKDDCSGRGMCVNSTCSCRSGFVGSYCQHPDCKDNCNGRGLCDAERGVCNCLDNSLYGGDFCELKKCPNNCTGQGTCLQTGACKCNEGFFGADCSPRNCPDNCNYPAGECVVTPQPEQVLNKTSGKMETVLSVARARGVCKCHPLFTGTSCGAARCPFDCSGHGTCDKATFQCKCQVGWGGKGCQHAECPKKCLNGGACFDGKCQCAPNFKGEDCAEPWLCPNHCSGKGDCRNGECFCSPGHAGEDCSLPGKDLALLPPPKDIKAPGCVPACHPDRGFCVLENNEFSCVCRSGFAGAGCAKTLEEHTKEVTLKLRDLALLVQAGKGPTVCAPACAKPHGHCIQLDAKTEPACMCTGGFSGPTCAIAPPAAPTPAAAAAAAAAGKSNGTATGKAPAKSFVEAADSESVDAASAETAPAEATDMSFSGALPGATPSSASASSAAAHEAEASEASDASSSSASSASSSSSSSAAAAPSSLVEVGASASRRLDRASVLAAVAADTAASAASGGQASGSPQYEDSAAMLLARALETDQREDAMLLQTLDQIVDY